MRKCGPRPDGVNTQIKVVNQPDWTNGGRFFKSPAILNIPDGSGFPRAVQIRARYLQGNAPLRTKLRHGERSNPAVNNESVPPAVAGGAFHMPWMIVKMVYSRRRCCQLAIASPTRMIRTTFTNQLVFSLLSLLLLATVAPAQDDPAKVRGTVTNYLGDPIPDVEVQFYQLDDPVRKYSFAEGKLIKSVRTDKDGNYKVEDLPWGKYRVTAGASEVWKFYLWRSADRVLNFGQSQEFQDWLPQLEVYGKIRNKRNVAIENVTVTLVNAFDGTEVIQTRTNKNGEYRIELIQPGQYIIHVSKPNFLVKATAFLINGNSLFGKPVTGVKRKIDLVLDPIK